LLDQVIELLRKKKLKKRLASVGMIEIFLLYIPIAITILIGLLRFRTISNIARCIMSTISCISMLIPSLIYYYKHTILIVEKYIQIPYIGNVVFWINPISAPIILTTGIVATCVSIYSLSYMEHRCEELKIGLDLSRYYILYILYILGLMGMVYSRNLIIMFIFLELAAITSFLLILMYGYGDRYRVALLYLVWSQVASLLVLCGIILMYVQYGTFMITSIHIQYAGYVYVAFFLILVGFLIKMGTFMVHFWLPWAHAEAPSPVSAILSPVHIGIAGFVLMEILHTFYSTLLKSISIPLTAYGIITMIYGGAMALSENDIKRFLAYSSISHMGSMVICIALCNYIGEVALILVFIAHALAKSLLFMFGGFCITRLGYRSFTDLFGLYDVYRPVAVAGIIGFISLSGIFNIGLFSKIYLTLTMLNTVAALSLNLKIFMIIMYIIALLVTIAYCFYAMRRLYFGTAQHLRRVRPLYSMDIPIILLSILTIVLMIPQVLNMLLFGVSKFNYIILSRGV